MTPEPDTEAGKVPKMDIRDPELIREFKEAVERGNESVRASAAEKENAEDSNEE